MQTQDDDIKKMSLTIQALDKLNKVNNNINEQNEKMNNLKDGLRRKSDSLVGNLRNIAGQLTSSASLHNSNNSKVYFLILNIFMNLKIKILIL